MAKRKFNGLMTFSGLFTILILLLITPATAAISDIPAGGKVFIGEEGLDITACGIVSGDTIGWFEAGRTPATSNPTVTIVVSDATTFYVSPQIFSGKTGFWYNMGTGAPAFDIASPSLRIRVYDVAYGQTDRTGIWVPMDYELQFRIETNLDVMSQRPGVAGAPIEVRVTRQNGVEYSSLKNRAGVTTPLIFTVDRNPYMTGPVWYPDAGYSRGVYDFYAFCNANGMRDNYEIIGETITPRSETISLSREITPTPTTPAVTVTITPSPTMPPATPPPTTPGTETPTAPPTETPGQTVPQTTEAAPSMVIISLAALGLITLLRVRK